MIITDKYVIKELKTVRCYELEENLNSYPVEEIGDKSEVQILAEEVAYLLSLYEEGTCTGEAYEEAINFIRETKNGKILPCYKTLPPVPKYSKMEFKRRLEESKEIINERKRLISLMDRLNKKGYFA